MKEGYIKLYRKITHNHIWQDPQKLRLWLLCLLKASHQQKQFLIENQVIVLSPGQFITGRHSIEEDYNKELQTKFRVFGKTLWRWLKVLETQGFVSIKSTNKYSIITIVNWILYQRSGHPLSSNSPESIHELSTNKNEKNEKNDKKLFSSSKKQSNLTVLDSLLNHNLNRKEDLND